MKTIVVDVEAKRVEIYDFSLKSPCLDLTRFYFIRLALKQLKQMNEASETQVGYLFWKIINKQRLRLKYT